MQTTADITPPIANKQACTQRLSESTKGTGGMVKEKGLPGCLYKRDEWRTVRLVERTRESPKGTEPRGDCGPHCTSREISLGPGRSTISTVGSSTRLVRLSSTRERERERERERRKEREGDTDREEAARATPKTGRSLVCIHNLPSKLASTKLPPSPLPSIHPSLPRPRLPRTVLSPRESHTGMQASAV